MNQNFEQTRDNSSEEQLSTVLWIVSFIIPLVGIILYFSNKATKPIKAKGALSAAIWGVAVSLGFMLIQYMTGSGAGQ